MRPARATSAAALAFTVVLAGCAGESGSAQGFAGSALSGQHSGTSSGRPSATLTGPRLATALDAPDSQRAAGLSEQPGLRRDSTDVLQVPDSTPVVRPSCIKLTTNIWATVTGLSGLSFAQAGFVRNTKDAIEMDEEIDLYPAPTAARFISVLARLAGRCRRFADRKLKDELTIRSTTRFTDLGQGGLRIVVDSRDYVNLFVLEAVRYGNAIVTTLGAADTERVAQGLAHAAAKRIVTRLRTLR